MWHSEQQINRLRFGKSGRRGAKGKQEKGKSHSVADNAEFSHLSTHEIYSLGRVVSRTWLSIGKIGFWYEGGKIEVCFLSLFIISGLVGSRYGLVKGICWASSFWSGWEENKIRIHHHSLKKTEHAFLINPLYPDFSGIMSSALLLSPVINSSVGIPRRLALNPPPLIVQQWCPSRPSQDAVRSLLCLNIIKANQTINNAGP